MIWSISLRQVLLMDGLGALLSAVLLWSLPDIGVSDRVMSSLSLSALAMAVCSLTCCLSSRLVPGYLRMIATFNVLYCLGTLAVMVTCRATISWLGIAYFVTEIAIMSQLVRLELHAAGSRMK